MKLFDEIQARYITPDVGRRGRFVRSTSDPRLGLARMHMQDRSFQRVIDASLRESIGVGAAMPLSKKER